MIFGQILARFRPHASKQGRIKDKPQQPLLEASESLKSIKELNQALKAIDQAIQDKTATNQQRLLKAEILLRKGKFHQAKAVLTELRKTSKDRKTRKTSNHLLDNLPQLQQKAKDNKSRTLISDLFNIAEKYQIKLSNLPEPEQLTPNCDITFLIRKESRLARSSELPYLSYELIEHTLKSGVESPWLIHDKALSLNMMGQQETALKLLKDLKKTTEKENLSKTIHKNIEAIQKNTNNNDSKVIYYFAKHAEIAIKRNNPKVSFPINSNKVNKKKIVNTLIREARSALIENPRTSLDLVDSILNYFPDNSAALLLKGEALAVLQKPSEALKIWTDLIRSEDQTTSRKASDLVSQHFSSKAKIISKKKSPEKAISFFIQEHLKLNLSPMLNKDLGNILRQLKSFDGTFQDPELEQHQMQLLFNARLLRCLEAHLSNQGRLGGTSSAQKPGAIRKTAPKAG